MQNRIRDYKEPILSFDHNIFNLGFHNPGRYCGFDTLEQTAALTFKLKHTGTGVPYKNAINTLKGPIGVLLSPQGVIIMEDEDITGFTIDSNAGNGEIRYDLVVCTHSYTAVAGGAPATYSVIKGTMGSPIKPILADPYHQVAVGVIEIPSNATNLDVCTYTRYKCPDSGDGEDARLNDPNVFRATQLYCLSDSEYTLPADENTNGSIFSKLWAFRPDGNVYVLNPALPITFDGFVIKDIPNQEGSRISVIAGTNVTFRNTNAWQVALAGKGYKQLNIPPSFANVVTPGVGNGLGLNPAAGETWELEFVMYQSKWWLVKLGGVNSSGVFKRGMIIEWYGDIINNFDDTGLGINLLSGWGICNGNHLTPDRRGKAPVMATEVPSLGAADISIVGGIVDPDEYVYTNPYTTSGKKQILIQQGHLPDYALPDPGHTHNILGITGGDNSDNNNQQRFAGGDKNPGETAFYFTNAIACQPASTGITLGGGGGKLPILNPVWATINIMKL